VFNLFQFGTFQQLLRTTKIFKGPSSAAGLFPRQSKLSSFDHLKSQQSHRFVRMFPQTPPSEGEEPFPRYTAQTPVTALLDRNRAWAERQERENPLLFPSLANSQHPQILWIGCSDSRVPETTVLDLLPGELFVHRNIANVVSAGDLSVLSVVQFAVEVLQVNHIIVCGTVAVDSTDKQDIMDVEDVLLLWEIRNWVSLITGFAIFGMSELHTPKNSTLLTAMIASVVSSN
jgi:Carbonic anhydrase